LAAVRDVEALVEAVARVLGDPEWQCLGQRGHDDDVERGEHGRDIITLTGEPDRRLKPEIGDRGPAFGKIGTSSAST
jgi:hypothetical protein